MTRDVEVFTDVEIMSDVLVVVRVLRTVFVMTELDELDESCEVGRSELLVAAFGVERVELGLL